ncbi:MAG: hypothetical protein ACLT98_07035 [Eggerthellaceae bacterium]
MILLKDAWPRPDADALPRLPRAYHITIRQSAAGAGATDPHRHDQTHCARARRPRDACSTPEHYCQSCGVMFTNPTSASMRRMEPRPTVLPVLRRHVYHETTMENVGHRRSDMDWSVDECASLLGHPADTPQWRKSARPNSNGYFPRCLRRFLSHRPSQRKRASS